MRDETSWIGVRHLFSREPLKRRDKNANLFCACTFVLYVTQRNLIIKAKYPPCRVKRGLKTLAYPQGRYPLCSFVQPTFASHRDRATGGTVADKARGLHSHCKSRIRIFNCGFYTRDITHRAGNVHCFFSLFFYFCAGVSLSASASVSLSASFAVSDAWSSS